MAISKTVFTEYGVDFPDAYLRVESVQLPSKTLMTFSLCTYAVSPQQETGIQPVRTEVVSTAYNLSGENPIKQAYEHLKSLPEFADAVDC